jgi:hypothetical protein
VLSVVLVVGGFGAPVAAADTETEGSLSHGLGDPSHETDTTTTTTTTETVGPTETGIVGTLPSLLGGLDGGTLFGTQHEGTEHEETARAASGAESSALAGPMSIGVTAENQPPAAAPAAQNNKGSDTVPAGATEAVKEPEVPKAVVSTSAAADPTPEREAPAADVLPPAADAPPPAADAPPPAVDPPAAETAAVQPVATEIAKAENSPAPVQAETAQLIGSAAPASDLVTALAYLVIALTDDSVPFIAIPDGLLSVLGFSAMGDGLTVSVNTAGIGGSLRTGGRHSAVRTQHAPSGALQAGWPQMLVALRTSSRLPSSDVVHSTPGGVGASGMAEQHSVGVKAVLADGWVPEDVRSVVQHTVDAFLAPLSFVVLAALASPGLAGMVLLTVAGMFVGYRQAKAASMLRAVNITRFVRSGPLGVVRSGGLVALHHRSSHTADEEPRRTKRHLESVA